MNSKPLDRDSGTTILPIPPPLEFPYPWPSPLSSNAPSVVNPAASSSRVDEVPVTGSAPKSSKQSAASDSIDDDRHAQPRPQMAKKRFMTGRPAQAKGHSFLGPKRRTTAINSMPVAAYNPDSDSLDSSSSSENEELSPATRTRSRTSGRSVEQGSLGKSKKQSGRGDQDEGRFSKFSVGNDKYKTKGKVSKRDGRLNISVNETANSGYLAKALGATLHNHLGSGKHEDRDEQSQSPLDEDDNQVRPSAPRTETASTLAASIYETLPPPKLNIVIMVIGSRGDIQPFLKIGKVLKDQHGHRVRIATHPAFKEFVERDTGLEFFSVGGDPAELMAFMVKNPGLVPSMSTVRAGEIGRRREAMYEMFQGFWRACINATDDETDIENVKMMYDKHPFVADAIIANPPSFAHIHCAERLGIPLHLMFTFPYTPTQQFPHPLANIKATNVDTNYTNFMSYPLVEMM